MKILLPATINPPRFRKDQVCYICGTKDNLSKDKRFNSFRCKPCTVKLSQKYRKDNLDKVKKSQKNYYQRNKDKIKLRVKKYAKLNKVKLSNSRKIYYLNNKELFKDRQLKRNFGISLMEYNKIKENQNNKCAICKINNEKNKVFHTDHNHTTGKVRGLLCTNCNIGIGQFKDNILILKNAIIYLKKYE